MYTNEENIEMNCLDFRRLALSDPNSSQPSFIIHGKECPDCRQYIAGVMQMDADLSKSIDVQMPASLMARLELNQILEEEAQESARKNSGLRRYAMAASFAAALFVSGFFASNYFGSASLIDEDYQALLAGVAEHMNEQPLTPVWDAQKANESANTHLANYDGEMQLKFLENLQFSRICPMGQYRGLHASLETSNGQVTFAYIKGDRVDDLLDASYKGYVARIKPVRGGNLIIMSRTNKALQVADRQLEKAIYWDI